MNSIEFFSGAGGLAKGLELAGAHHMAFVEWNADACRTLRANFSPQLVFENDIRKFPFTNFKNIDIVAGGPPCQPFSLGGKAMGHTDERDMFPAAIEAIRMIKPKAFIFENVKGLLRQSFAKYFEFIILQLRFPEIKLDLSHWKDNVDCLRSSCESQSSILRYNVTYNLVNAADYGVPQKRERVIIVGFRSDLHVDWKFPKKTHSEDALLWSRFVSGEYWERHGVENYFDKETTSVWQYRLKNRYGLWQPEEKPWQTVRDALVGLGEPSGKGDHLLREGAREYPGHTGSFIDEPSKTIKAGDHGVPGGENMLKFPDGSLRYLSVAEAKRIQTFPDDYSITGSWTEAMRQLGNAVPVRLAEIVGKSVIDSLSKAAAQKNIPTAVG